MTELLKQLAGFDIRLRANPPDPMDLAWRVVKLMLTCFTAGLLIGHFVTISVRTDWLPRFSSYHTDVIQRP